MDLQRDFTVASPAEFVTRFGGTRVIEKVNKLPNHVFYYECFFFLHYFLISVLFSVAGINRQQWHSCGQMYAIHPALGLRDVPQ